MRYPYREVSRPAVLDGMSNGLLPDRILVTTPGQAGGPGVRLVAPAARAWRALTAAALRDGHVLKISGSTNAYRPYADQERIFRQRFTTTPVSSTRRWWLGRWWYLRPGYALAAVPGTSNHGWALAVDTGEERDGDTGAESLDVLTLSWLIDNELRFGWSHELDSEPWHLRYFAGDRIPAAVLEHERGTAPPPDDEEDDMGQPYALWRRHNQAAVYRIPADASLKVHVPSPAALDFDQRLLRLGGYSTEVVVIPADEEEGLAWFDGLPVREA